MYKSGLILGALTLFVAAGATLISPLCTPCAAIFLGLGAGYLAGVFNKPATSSAMAQAGAIAGAVGGIGAVLGQVIGTVLNGVIVGPQGVQAMYQSLGLPTSGPRFEQGYWLGIVGGGICFSLLDLLLMAGFGSLGGLLWWRTSGQKAGPPSPSFMG